MTNKEERRARVLGYLDGKQLMMGEVCTLLGLSERQVWRLLGEYRMEGLAAVVHGNRGRRPVHATPKEVQEKVVRLAGGVYDGANYTHMAELLAERDEVSLSRWTVRRILREAGIGSPRRRRRSKHRSRRERYPQEGMLLQVDGSEHDWLAGASQRLTLLAGIDDATGTVPYALFRVEEDAHGYFLLLRGVLERKGRPVALYSDRHSIFVRSSQERETLEEQLLGRRELTQVGRALEELGIQWIGASSPQAKGRIERLWQTFQDRLVLELRLAGATTVEEANAVLWAFLTKFNAQFAVPAREPGSAYRPVPEGTDLEAILSFQYARTVGSDNTVQFFGRVIQLLPTAERSSYARLKVEVQERLDGRVVVCYRGTVLAALEAPLSPVTLRARRGPRPQVQDRLGERVSPDPSAPLGAQGPRGAVGGPLTEDRPAPGAKSQTHKPAPNHPWKKRLLTNSLHH